MFVHAHPDDEVIATGATMAHYAADRDTRVVLVTCTLGEMGEVLIPELINLRADHADQLGGYRIGELERACAALGVTDHRFLGGAGRWRDSGMMSSPSNADPRSFWRADLTAASEALVRIVREVRPQVMVTYDAIGDYGHPDHIRAHDVTVRAFDDAADPDFAPQAGEPWQVSKLYETALSRAAVDAAVDQLWRSDLAKTAPEGISMPSDMLLSVPDAKVTTRIEAPDFFAAKVEAMRAHRTQMTVDGFFFALVNGDGQAARATEHYVLARGTPGPPAASGKEDDLFAGLVP
ncbi:MULTISPECIES: N-acetyl-1-D-myo-inositol-2-amino-2-deoxy-alpha-D-glucopyranoside deacetylase [Frankia]|uniref:N-acetyl-1-D-myo-inositol-2-amino-2-deoxy-alpha- D-glucopyranoside deacetylase n=3 Tax=Frankiaceae TaxID=74712 RepID=UPI002740864F|nr:N-acetyl-1-D-myo-inositol-2-amino-2-deoxy-alpha-D-glucopyranoside deacetylase [Frankia sp. AvcI1]